MKELLLWLIKGYQKWISPIKPKCCRFYPSCSKYAAEALKRHGAGKGSILAVWRILRCNPWNRGGIDFVPEDWKTAFPDLTRIIRRKDNKLSK